MSKAIDTGLLVRPPSDVGALQSTDRVLINRSGNSASTNVASLTSLSPAPPAQQLATAWYVLSSNSSATAFTLNRSYGISSIVYNVAGGGSGTSGNVLHWSIAYSTPLSNRFVSVGGSAIVDRGTTGNSIVVVTDQVSTEPTTYAMSTTGVKITVQVLGAAAVDNSHTVVIFGT